MIVSNSSPIMNLAIIGQLDLLQKLYGKITIPEEVWKELVMDGEGKSGAKQIKESTWIERRRVENINLFQSLKRDLDIGEAAAITLAIEKNANLILLDESEARNVAELYNLPKTGIIGILLKAKRQSLIKAVKPYLNALKAEANFWIKDALYNRILTEVNEI